MRIATAAKVAVAAALAAAAGGLVVAVAADEPDPPPPIAVPSPRTAAPDADDQPLTPGEARRARAAALRATGGGQVVELDRSDDPGEAYEIEVVRDGAEYDVTLDARFRVVPNRRYDD